MKNNPFRIYCASAIVWLAASTHTPAQSRLQIERSGPDTIQIHGRLEQPAVLEASPDFENWETVHVPPVGSAFSYSDPLSAGNRSYRLRSIPNVVPELPDLSASLNSVFISNEGFNTVQFAPSGVLGFIVWRERELVLRERSSEGAWRESVVFSDGALFRSADIHDYRFQPLAVLLYDSASRPHILRVSGSNIVRRTRQTDGAWTQETIAAGAAGGSFMMFAAEFGPDGKLHLALVNGDTALTYGSNRDGAWHWSRVAGSTGGRNLLPFTFAPRYFSLAVDSKNAAHLVYPPEFRLPQIGQYIRPYSELAYASNRSGAWRIETISKPLDQSGDAGMGASIAIGPDDQPAVASWFNERVDTGSANWSQLMYHRRQRNGAWSSSVVSKSHDGYVAGDGERGTGFAPYLRFDLKGRPHIAFSDHACEHFPNSGQNAYGGQIRHALLEGDKWSIATVLQQREPLRRQIVYPAMALSGEEAVFIALERLTHFGPDSWPRKVRSDYRFVMATRPLH